MPDALSHFDALVLALLPDGTECEDDVADVQRAAEAVNAILDRRRPKQYMPKWIRQPDGRFCYDINGTATAEEEAEATAKRTEMVAHRKAPGVANWNPLSVCHTTGATPEEARFLFPDKASWDRWKAKNGKFEISKDEAIRGGFAAKPAVVAPPTQDEVERVMKHMRESGQLTADGEINPDAPRLPPVAAPSNGNPLAKRTDPDLDVEALDDSDAAGEIGGPDSVVDVPFAERPDVGEGDPGMIGVIGSPGTKREAGALSKARRHVLGRTA